MTKCEETSRVCTRSIVAKCGETSRVSTRSIMIMCGETSRVSTRSIVTKCRECRQASTTPCVAKCADTFVVRYPQRSLWPGLHISHCGEAWRGIRCRRRERFVVRCREVISISPTVAKRGERIVLSGVERSPLSCTHNAHCFQFSTSPTAVKRGERLVVRCREKSVVRYPQRPLCPVLHISIAWREARRCEAWREARCRFRDMFVVRYP